MRQFYAIAGFPGVTDCVDCNHVPIRRPEGVDAEVFRNLKEYFSVNVQAITGPQLQFFFILWQAGLTQPMTVESSTPAVPVLNTRTEVCPVYS
ncbi:hypothetical protein HPB48_015705 [Haemaphysalis longicornis]|uniref:DDE Tnp4 domain-containing protein n=1 Tax=Haemaphysalis longicornis TaxID=44386 RepID=A0A9J6GUE3_HAELO|nr:hypothetical protein HPB48_015705 [Haemaphysalis longicornis]